LKPKDPLYSSLAFVYSSFSSLVNFFSSVLLAEPRLDETVIVGLYRHFPRRGAIWCFLPAIEFGIFS